MAVRHGLDVVLERIKRDKEEVARVPQGTPSSDPKPHLFDFLPPPTNTELGTTLLTQGPLWDFAGSKHSTGCLLFIQQPAIYVALGKKENLSEVLFV